jgi:type I protein arginine methyltransferase
VYEIPDYDGMFADDTRTNAYLAAIARAVNPGSVVVEVGTGVGYFAVAACRAGARHVYAIDMHPAIELAERVASDNGCADRITFIREDSRRVHLPEPGDVLLSDLRGVLPPYESHIPTIVDARRRLLRPGGVMVPLRDTLWAAPCLAPESWFRDHVAHGEILHGISRRAVTERVRSDWLRCRLEETDMLADGCQWAELDYATVDSPAVEGSANWTFEHDGAAEGVAAWFDADFGFDVLLSNAPTAPRALYAQAFFPFARALSCAAGDRLTVDFRAHLVNGDYVWGWDTTLAPAAAGAPPVSFRQSNLAARIGSLERLRGIGKSDNQDDRTSPPIPSTG